MAILVCFAAGSISALFISADAGSWYDALQKPFFTPAPWTFPFILFAMYALMACALASIWMNDPHPHDFRGWVPLFFAHLLPSMAWTILFFGFHVTFISLLDLLVVTAAVFLLFMEAWEARRFAAYFLIPYLAWLFFMLVVNLSIWYLN